MVADVAETVQLGREVQEQLDQADKQHGDVGRELWQPVQGLLLCMRGRGRETESVAGVGWLNSHLDSEA